MAITKGAKKAHRQSLRKRTMNIARKNAVHAALKAARVAEAGEAAAKHGALAAAYKAIDKAHKRGIIKKNTAARRKAKVAKLLKA